MSLVSIGLPVYNGEAYLRIAVESILAQTFTDFELIICDNDSTDATETICRDLAAQDDRIRYHRNKINIGAGPNFNLAFELATGKYFKWAAHDDICEPEYLAECVSTMEAEGNVVLCHSEVRWIDDHGEPLPPIGCDVPDVDSDDCKLRFKRLISLNHGCFDVFGLIRRDILARTPLIASFIGSDRSLLAELGLHGKIARVDRALFLSRDHAARSIRDINLYDRSSWWDTSLKRGLYLPWWRILREMPAIIHRVPLNAWDKLRCYTIIPGWMISCRRGLFRELVMLLKHALSPSQRRGKGK
jgi:glycosyltransferase involved in cell wall biosynthesis